MEDRVEDSLAVRKRNYVGLASSWRQAGIAIVSSSGELVFAEASEACLDRDAGWDSAQNEDLGLAKIIERYCEPDAQIVVALATNAKQVVCPPAEAGVPRALRSAAAYRACKYQREASMLSGLASTMEYELQRLHGWPQVGFQRRHFDHHLTHAAAACITGPYAEAVCAVLDGSEERACRCYMYRGGEFFEISPVRRPPREESLGMLYREVCDACGFRSALGEQWKVMSLASYGELDSNMYQAFAAHLTADGFSLRFGADRRMPEVDEWIEPLSRIHDDPIMAAANLARTGQAIFEEALYSLLRNIHGAGISDNLVLTGGCALNSSANGGITANTRFRSVHVPCAPSNEGNAVGAALLAYREDNRTMNRRPGFQTPFLGLEVAAKRLGLLIEAGGFSKVQMCSGDAPQRAASILAEGKIVGWIQGRAEFGPRALGNRSILADLTCRLSADQSRLRKWLFRDWLWTVFA